MKKNVSSIVILAMLMLVIQLVLVAAGIFAYDAFFSGVLFAQTDELEKLRFDVLALTGALILSLILFCAVFSLLISRLKKKERECAHLIKKSEFAAQPETNRTVGS